MKMMMVLMMCWQFELTTDPDDEDYKNSDFNDELTADRDNDDYYEDKSSFQIDVIVFKRQRRLINRCNFFLNV